MPSHVRQGDPLLLCLLPFCRTLSAITDELETPFLIPDIGLEGGSPRQGATWKPRPMPHHKLQEAFRALLVRAGVTPAESCSYSLYALRWTLPTGADALEFPEADADLT